MKCYQVFGKAKKLLRLARSIAAERRKKKALVHFALHGFCAGIDRFL